MFNFKNFKFNLFISLVGQMEKENFHCFIFIKIKLNSFM